MSATDQESPPFQLLEPPRRRHWAASTNVFVLLAVAGVLLVARPTSTNSFRTQLSAISPATWGWWWRGERCSDYSKCPCEDLLKGTPSEDREAVPDAQTYDAALKALDMEAVKHDLDKLMTQSQECWPADFDNYGPFFVRLAWHCSGTYRKSDGKGGCAGGRQRFEPERSWDDNTNLDKARALLVPIKQKYGHALSWGDLYALAGTQALRGMGTPITSFCFGRIDSKDGSESLALGPSPEQERFAPCKINGKCKKPLGATTVGLIYVNPEGPIALQENGEWKPNPDPILSSREVRTTFEQMKHEDRAAVALIGGGHAFGKAHGACQAGAGPSPKDAYPHGIPWPGLCGTGKGKDTTTSGFEGHWTTTPTKWSNEFFQVLQDHEWEKWVGPGGKWQWRTVDRNGKYAGVMRLTSDISLLQDKHYRAIVNEFATNQTALDDAFDKAWQELVTHGGSWSNERKCDHICSINGQLQPCPANLAGDSYEMKTNRNVMLQNDVSFP